LSNFCNLPDYRITNISNLFQESWKFYQFKAQ
jgi:hypothetical protein